MLVPAALGRALAPGLLLRTALPALPDPPCVMWQGVVVALGHDVVRLHSLVAQADHGGGGATLQSSPREALG
eukprot:8168209-Alexandrium_andersonii.AAC.1